MSEKKLTSELLEAVAHAKLLYSKKIEQLQSAITAANEENKRLREEARWIPVGERLPEARNTDTEWSEKVQVCHVKNRHIDHDWYLVEKKRWHMNPLGPYSYWRPITLPEGE